MIKSRICEILGIKYPIFQGGMAWIADASLASAVSNAGGLGLISSINAGTEAVRNEIRKCKELTDKPFGVNIMLQAPNAGEIAQMVIEEGVKILTTGAGSHAQYMESWQAAGIKVIRICSPCPQDAVNRSYGSHCRRSRIRRTRRRAPHYGTSATGSGRA